MASSSLQTALMLRLSYMLLLICLALLTLDTVSGLKCYECVNVKLDVAARNALQSIFNTRESWEKLHAPGCDYASVLNMRDLSSRTCQRDEVCAAIHGNISISPITEQYNVSMRACARAPSDKDLGCIRDALAREYMDLPDSVVSMEQFRGDICFCDTDLCSAGFHGCAEDQIKAFGYCLRRWLYGLIVTGIFVLTLLVVLACCVCFCRCYCGRN